MENITLATTIGELEKIKEFQDRDYMTIRFWDDEGYIMPGCKISEIPDMSLSDVQREFPTWNMEQAAVCLEQLKRRAQEEPVFFDIWDQEERKKDTGKCKTGITAFLRKEKSKFALICPGGAYSSVCSITEGFPVAEYLNQKGYAAFVLQYRVSKEAQFPNPQDDLARALQFIMDHKEEFHIDVTDYALIGFSAGGHLAASFGLSSVGYKKYGLPEPGVEILGYPVISMGEFAHALSRENLLGSKAASEKEKKMWSVEENIDPEYPPVYVWQCKQDNAVPVQNSMLFAEALEKNEVTYIYRQYPGEAHGWGLALGTEAEGWMAEAIAFWENLEDAKNHKNK